MNIEVAHESNAQRFVAVVEGQECVIEYRLSGKTMTITHTGVPASLGGRGIAAQLTRFALDHARSKGWKVVPACSYAAGYFEKHPEVSDLLA
ncbi:GNAT family N-acetyltransferase [Dokdonella sp.]|uniref:GNAT family N-acetyltransferase n=1 Tax=Dokdonella sp. TaxID=2291710 RepID=UPI0035290450